MIPQNLYDWFFRWTREWLLPKVGIAVAVTALSKIIFSMDEKIWFTGLARSRFNEIFDETSSPIFLWALCILGLLLIASLAIRASRDKIGLTWLAFERSSSLICSALIGIFGLLLVPLTVAGSWVHYSGAEIPPSLPLLLYKSAVIFICLGAAIHWLSGEETNPPEHITYRLVPTQAVSSERATHQTLVRLSEVLSHVDFVDAPISVAHSKDNEVTLVIPLKLSAKSWPPAALQSLSIYLDAIEREWENESKWNYTRSLPRGLEHTGYQTFEQNLSLANAIRT